MFDKDEKKKEHDDPYALKYIYEEMELELVASFQRNLVKHKMDEYAAGFSWEMWQLAMLRNIETYRKENKAIIGKYEQGVQNIIDKTLQHTYTKGERNTDEQMGQIELDAGSYSMPENGKNTGKRGELPPQEKNFFRPNEKKLNAMIESTKNDFEAVNHAVYRKMDDVYRQTIYKTAMQLANGSISLDKAIDHATESFLSKGIDSIVYANGRRVNIATYAEMALRTTSHRATLLGEGSKRDEYGNHLVVVSAHANSCQLCMQWQGQVLIDDVFSHPSEDYPVKHKQKYKLLSQAIKTGLMHPNCRHTISTYFKGITRLPTITDSVEAKKNYDVEQKQRRLENEIRKAKRESIGVVDEEKKRIAMKRLLALQRQLRDHLKANPQLKRHAHREKVYDISKIKSNISSGNGTNEFKKGIDKELMPEIKEGTKIMNKEFPMFKELVDKISYDHETIKEYAYSETGIEKGKVFSSVKLGRWFSNKQTLMKGIQRDIDGGHTFKGATPTSIVIHEFTHALEVNLTLKDMGISTSNVSDMQWKSFMQKYGYISSSIKEQALSNIGIEFMQPKWYKMYEDLGAYAKMNSNEFMAQCISQALTVENPSAIALEVYRLLKERVK